MRQSRMAKPRMLTFKRCLSEPMRINKLRRVRFAFDSWYSGEENLKLIDRSGWTFFTTLKSNRKVSISKETGYQDLEELDWDAESLRNGQLVRLQKVPFLVRLFKLVANLRRHWMGDNKRPRLQTARGTAGDWKPSSALASGRISSGI